jgi:hypothetical protein
MGRFKSFDEFLDLFPAKPRQRIKNGYNVLCPAHDDHKPSLSVTLNGYKILLNCKAGCPTPQILARLNLSESDQFLDDSQTPTIEATYPYLDEHGQLLFEVVRYKPKDFRARRPDSNGGWIWNMQGVKQVIYHLPDIVRAIAKGDDIYVTEGERDCDSLWAIGLAATTNPFGAGKWRNEYSQSLQGAKVVVIPDNDDEGRRHAISVIDSLEGKVKSLEVLEIPPAAKDVTEWLEQEHTHEDLLSLETKPPNVYKNTYFNNKREDFGDRNGFSLKSGQVSGQVVDKLRDYGELSEPFDDFLKENPEPHWKREVAEIIGTTYKDQAFIKLVQRRAKDGMIRISHGGDKIQWVNRDWQKSKISLEGRERSHLNLLLPFEAEQYVAIPERSQIVIAGDIGSGKTHYGYLMAELNVGSLPIRHFVNEMGDAKAVRLLDDFPRLLNHYDNDYHLISQDRENLEVAENLDCNGLNIYDYLHLPATKEWFLLLQRELARLSQPLERGTIVVMLQKKLGQSLAYGGEGTKMQCEVYMTLNIEQRQPKCKVCRIDIEKCRDWTNPDINPETKSYRYQTAPRHGQLIPYGSAGWFDREKDEKA